MRVVVVGAGASVEAGISTTKQLTGVAKKALPAIVVPGVPYTVTGQPTGNKVDGFSYIGELQTVGGIA